MTLKQQIAYRAKAILATLGLALVGLLEWVVQNPQTATWLQQYVPAPYTQLVPIVIGAVSAFFVHQVPNATPASIEPSVTAATTDTTLLNLPNAGEIIGEPAR